MWEQGKVLLAVFTGRSSTRNYWTPTIMILIRFSCVQFLLVAKDRTAWARTS